MLQRLTAALVLLIATVASAQSLPPYQDVASMPDTPIGKRMTRLLETLSSGDVEAARVFISDELSPDMRDAFTMAEHLAVFREAYLVSRGYDFYSTRYYDPPRPGNELVAIVRNRLTEAWEGVIMEVDPEPPHRVTALNFAPARPPVDLPPPGPISERELIKEIESFATRLTRFNVFSGSILIARRGAIVSLAAWGPASIRYGVPNEVDTKYNLGSMNKMFTAVAIGQLVEQGKLAFDDPVGRHLGAEWLAPEYSGQITIAQLLNHTSGLGNYFNDAFRQSARSLFRSVDDFRPLVAGERPAFPPGTQERYSNTGFLLLGAVIEAVTGEDYHDYVRENIYEPAGMVNTAEYAMDEPVPNLAMGYTRHVDAEGQVEWRNNLFRHVIRGGPAGGGFSTVEDLFRFSEAMRNDAILSAATKRTLWSAKPGSPAYGYGFSVIEAAGGTVVGHGGGFPGISGQLDIRVESGYTIAVLSNYDRGAEHIVRKFREMMTHLSDS